MVSKTLKTSLTIAIALFGASVFASECAEKTKSVFSCDVMAEPDGSPIAATIPVAHFSSHVVLTDPYGFDATRFELHIEQDMRKEKLPHIIDKPMMHTSGKLELEREANRRHFIVTIRSSNSGDILGSYETLDEKVIGAAQFARSLFATVNPEGEVEVRVLKTFTDTSKDPARDFAAGFRVLEKTALPNARRARTIAWDGANLILTGFHEGKPFVCKKSFYTL